MIERYTLPEMGRVWSEAHKYELWCQVEVLVLVARGASTRHVARTLNITPKTAGNHIERIYAKIGASSRSTATLFALQHGMLATLEPVQR